MFLPHQIRKRDPVPQTTNPMPHILRKPKENLQLYKALNLGYTRDENKQKNKLKRYGYVYDKELSNGERMVAYNPSKKQLLFVDNGTGTKDDLATDLILGTAGIKATKRYDEDKNAYLKARNKYEVTPEKTVFAGHSLGGALVSAIAPKNSQIYTYNAAIGKQETRGDALNLRTQGDIFSSFAPSQKVTTLANPNAPTPLRPVNAILKAHQTENLKDVPVYF
jgi:hypothetical protein